MEEVQTTLDTQCLLVYVNSAAAWSIKTTAAVQMSTVKFFFFFFTQKKDAEIQRLHRVEPQDVFVTPLWFKFLKIVADFFFFFFLLLG